MAIFVKPETFDFKSLKVNVMELIIKNKFNFSKDYKKIKIL